MNLEDKKQQFIPNPPDPETAGAWIQKEKYTPMELQQMMEAHRVYGIWRLGIDPDTCFLESPKGQDMARNYVNCLNVAYPRIEGLPAHCPAHIPTQPFLKDAYAVVAKAVREGRYKTFYSVSLSWEPKADILDIIGRDLEIIKKNDTYIVAYKCRLHWARDNSLSIPEKEKLANEYAETLYNWSRCECTKDFEPKSISETKAHMAYLLELNKDYVSGKWTMGLDNP